MGIKGLIVPGACFVASLTVLVPDNNHKKEESRKGIKYHPGTRKVNYTPTLLAGPWVYIAGKTAGDMQTTHGAPVGLPHHFSDIEVQTRHTSISRRPDGGERHRLVALPPHARVAGQSSARLPRLHPRVARLFPRSRQSAGAGLCADDRRCILGRLSKSTQPALPGDNCAACVSPGAAAVAVIGTSRRAPRAAVPPPHRRAAR